METLNDMRGRDKREVINILGGDKAPAIYADFVEMLNMNVTRVKEIQGTSEAFRWLRNHSVAVGVESGFPAVVTHDIVKHLRWQEEDLIDYWTCSEIVDEERPSPAMILRTMRHCHVRDPSRGCQGRRHRNRHRRGPQREDPHSRRSHRHSEAGETRGYETRRRSTQHQGDTQLPCR